MFGVVVIPHLKSGERKIIPYNINEGTENQKTHGSV
jgi:hypothetical protein